MKRRAISLGVLLFLLIACGHQSVRMVNHVIFCGALLDASAYIEDQGHVFIDEGVVMEKACYLPVQDKKNVSFKTIHEEIIQIPIKKDFVRIEGKRRYVNMEEVFRSKHKTVFYDEAKRLLVVGSFDRKDLAYSDITKKETLNDPLLSWQWPEDGIEGVDVVNDKGSIAFVFQKTGEVLGTIEVNPKDFPKKEQILLGAKDGNYLVATVKEKAPRQNGEARSARSYAIDGILSLLTSVSMDQI